PAAPGLHPAARRPRRIRIPTRQPPRHLAGRQRLRHRPRLPLGRRPPPPHPLASPPPPTPPPRPTPPPPPPTPPPPHPPPTPHIPRTPTRPTQPAHLHRPAGKRSDIRPAATVAHPQL